MEKDGGVLFGIMGNCLGQFSSYIYFIVVLQSIVNGLFSDYAAVFSKLIARTAKDIDVLIDSLPSEESSLELQVSCCCCCIVVLRPR